MVIRRYAPDPPSPDDPPTTGASCDAQDHASQPSEETLDQRSITAAVNRLAADAAPLTAPVDTTPRHRRRAADGADADRTRTRPHRPTT